MKDLTIYSAAFCITSIWFYCLVTLYLSSYNYPFFGLPNACIRLLDFFSRLLITVIYFGRFIGIQSLEIYTLFASLQELAPSDEEHLSELIKAHLLL